MHHLEDHRIGKGEYSGKIQQEESPKPTLGKKKSNHIDLDPSHGCFRTENTPGKLHLAAFPEISLCFSPYQVNRKLWSHKK